MAENIPMHNVDGLTPLQVACGHGDTKAVLKLLSRGSDLYTLDSKMGVSALHKAVYSGNKDTVDLLLNHGALINLQSSSSGNTPLHDALYFKRGCDLSIIEVLLKHGANTNIINRAGLTPIESARVLNDKDAVKLLLEYEQNRQSQASKELMSAVKLNDFTKVEHLLKLKKINLEETDDNGFTPLLWASRQGYTIIVKTLLDYGANPNHLDQWMGATAGHKACFWGHADVLQLLVQHGLDLNARGGYNGYTALMDAVSRNHLDAAQILVESGANINISGHDGLTAMDIAQKNNNSTILKLLRQVNSTRPSHLDMDSQLIEVAKSQAQWTGVAVSKTGRIFVCFPRWSNDVPISVAEIKNGVTVAYPNKQWNDWKSGISPHQKFVCVQSVYIDKLDRLWLLDAASPSFSGVIKDGPKLVEINLNTNKVVHIYPINNKIVPEKSYLNDVRIDIKDNMAFISDSGLGAIITVNLATGKAARLLSNNYSTKAEDTTVIVNGQKWLRNGQSPKINIDGISLDNNEKYLYYQALTGRNLYRIKTNALLNPQTQHIDSQVEHVVKTFATDGIQFGLDRKLYLTSIEDNSLKCLVNNDHFETMVTSPQLDWPDSLAIGNDGYIYVTTSQIDLGSKPNKPYRLFKIKL